MSESRICPVCENEIPENATFVCPYCSFELKSLDDENAIEKARKIFKEEKYTKREIHKSIEDFQDKNVSKIKHFLPGILWVLVFSVSFELRAGHFYGVFLGIFGLPVVLVGGIISYQMEKKFKKSQRYGSGEFLFLLPIVLIIIAWNLFVG